MPGQGVFRTTFTGAALIGDFNPNTDIVEFVVSDTLAGRIEVIGTFILELESVDDEELCIEIVSSFEGITADESGVFRGDVQFGTRLGATCSTLELTEGWTSPLVATRTDDTLIVSLVDENGVPFELVATAANDSNS